MRRRGVRHFLLPAVGGAAILLVASMARAQRPYESYRTLSQPGYQEMRRLAQELDGQARHANDQAQHSQYRLYARDRTFVRAVANFARRASQFNYRLGTYQTRPWQVDDELRNLLRAARDVQNRVRNSRYIDEHTAADWNEVVNVLSEMINLYRSDVRGGAGPYGNREPYGNPTYHGGAPPAHPPGGSYGYSREQLASLAHELEDRATRAHELAERLATSGGPREQELFGSIHHFNDQARAFHQRIESGLSDPNQIRTEANHLLDDAREADGRMRQNNVFPEVWQEWQGAMQVLQRILNLVGV